MSAKPNPLHFREAQMGRWQPEGLMKGFFFTAMTPPTRLRRATSPFILGKNGEGNHG